MSIVWTKDQKKIIDEGVKHIRSNTGPQVYEFAGRAGTGKSTVFYEILRRSGLPFSRVAAMAYIGQAAINMRLKGLTNAKTIHSWLYRAIEVPKLNGDGSPMMDPYFNRPMYELKFVPAEITDIDVLFIDEAGTVPDHMRAEIEAKGIKIIATGDLAQLKPVYGNSAFLQNPNIVELTDIMRQDEGSIILHIADRASKGLPIHKGMYGTSVLVIPYEELNDRMIMSSDVVLCGTNRTRADINKHVREELLGIKSTLPVFGDRMVCRKNNWNVEVDGINLANGLNGTVVSHPNVTGYKKDYYTMSFKPFLTNSPFVDVLCDHKYLMADHKQRQFLKNDKYNTGEKFEYGYALTTHMAQGSQYNNGIYISEYMGKDMQPHIDYTGPTRFKKSMIYVTKGKRYF